MKTNTKIVLLEKIIKKKEKKMRLALKKKIRYADLVTEREHVESVRAIGC